MTGDRAPLTVGTAGHVDHGKTCLVKALTGVDTDRLAEEKARGISIVLGFAALRLPDGRMLSLVDAPGHERLIRVMVAGATGIDLFLLVIAANDGVMPQTREHIRVLDALGVTRGVVAITKSDLADPAPVAAAAAERLPAARIVSCCARTGAGIAGVAAALARTADEAPARSASDGAAVLHIDRVFTVKGAGTVVTGTLSSGSVCKGQRLDLVPGQRTVRVRGLQVHDRPVDRAPAGQRVAVNLVGIDRRAVSPGDTLLGPGAPVAETYRVQARLALCEPLRDRERVQVHHGTRSAPARAVRVDDTLWQLRTERPLLAADGDRLVVRRINPPDTIGGGVIVQARPPRRAVSTAGKGQRRPEPVELDAAALALEERLRTAGHEPLSEAELGAAVPLLAVLRAHGRAVRIGRSMHAHPDAIAEVRRIVQQVAADEGGITLARLRDQLHTSRKYAQALLEHLDATRVTLRLQDDSRVLRKAAADRTSSTAGADG